MTKELIEKIKIKSELPREAAALIQFNLLDMTDIRDCSTRDFFVNGLGSSIYAMNIDHRELRLYEKHWASPVWEDVYVCEI